jgi:glycine cleavage system H lipoate-binding protein/ABC-type phosphate transport system substrate-binding protein
MLQCQAGNFRQEGQGVDDSPVRKSMLTVTVSPDLAGVANGWAGTFMAADPDLKVNVTTLQAGEAMIGRNDGLTILSGDYPVTGKEGSVWKMVVGRDAIVAVFNSANPLLTEIVRQGVSAADLSKMIKNSGTRVWSDLLEGVQPLPVNFLLPANESLKSSLAAFTGLTADNLSSVQMAGGQQLVAAVQNDPNAMGFCKLTDILNADGQSMVSGISLLPIDRNANGRMDYIEQIYGNVADLSRGLWIGKYPSVLARNIYACAAAKPSGKIESAFLRHILTTGQQGLGQNGYITLSSTERLSAIDHLPSAFIAAGQSNPVNIWQLIITIFAGILIITAIAVMVIRNRKAGEIAPVPSDPDHLRPISERNVEMPKGLLFDQSHTWAFMESNGNVRVGIDDFLQHVTGSLSGIRMKKPGEKVRKGDHILTIVQNGKRLNISAPVSGIIRSENSALLRDASLLNRSPYGDGWIYLIEPTNWMREIQFLLMAEKHQEWLRGEFARLRDFLAMVVKPGDPALAHAVLQDGGEIADRVLEHFGPEVWEEFQTKFIETNK